MQRSDDIDRAASNGARRAVNFAELMVQGSARIFGIQAAAAVVAVFGALALAMSVATAQGDDDGNRFRTAIDAETVNGETLFVNRQHAGETSPVDQLIAIAPEDEDG